MKRAPRGGKPWYESFKDCATARRFGYNHLPACACPVAPGCGAMLINGVEPVVVTRRPELVELPDLLNDRARFGADGRDLGFTYRVEPATLEAILRMEVQS